METAATVLVIFLALVATFGFVIYCDVKWERKTKASYERVYVGMRESEIVSLIGAPEETLEEVDGRSGIWMSDCGRYSLLVEFDSSGRVSHIEKVIAE